MRVDWINDRAYHAPVASETIPLWKATDRMGNPPLQVY